MRMNFLEGLAKWTNRIRRPTLSMFFNLTSRFWIRYEQIVHSCIDRHGFWIITRTGFKIEINVYSERRAPPFHETLNSPCCFFPYAAYDHTLFRYSEFNHPKYYLKPNKEKSVSTWFVAIIELIYLIKTKRMTLLVK